MLAQQDGTADPDKVNELTEGFNKAMDADLNTAGAITALYDVLKADAAPADKIAAISKIDSVLSLSLISHAEKISETKEEPLPAEVVALAEQRQQARKEKNFALADKLRDEITALGYIVEETRQGTVIKKK